MDIVLQDNTTVVRYNRENRQLQLKRRSKSDALRPAAPTPNESICPGCGRAYPGNTSSNGDDSEVFLDRNYFQLLAEHVSGPSIDDNAETATEASTINSSRPIAIGLPAPPPPNLGGTETPVETEYISSSLPESAYNQGYYQRFFVEQEELGRGARGSVYKVTHVLDDIELGDYAVKKVAVGDNHAWLEKMLREVHVLRLRHRNLINFHHVWLEVSQPTKFGPPVPTLYLLQEYASGGDLERYVLSFGKTLPAQSTRRRRKKTSWPKQETLPLPVAEIFSFTKDIVAGLNYLHQNGIIHRDLKPSNCLMNIPKGGGIPRILVGDFGEGQLEGAKRAGPVGTGTVEYSAPETVVDEKSLKPVASTKLDMFSLGMVLHFLCFLGKLPYLHTSDDAHFQELREEVRLYGGYKWVYDRTDLPNQFHQLLALLLSPNPAERPSAKEVLQSLQEYPAWKISEESQSQAGVNDQGIDAHLSADMPPVFPISRRLTGAEDAERPQSLFPSSLSPSQFYQRWMTGSHFGIHRASRAELLRLFIKSVILILFMHIYPNSISTETLILFALTLSMDMLVW